MKENGKFLTAFNKFNVSKHAKIWFSVPLLIVTIAAIVIIAIGASTGSFSDAVGIGIDFEGGSVITVELGNDEKYDENMAKIKKAIEDHGVNVSYVQRQTGNGDSYFIAFRYKNISKSDAEIKVLNDKIIDTIDKLYPEISNADKNFITYESIGATAANDLLSKAGIAVVVSTLLILIYIIFRFTLVSGFAAVMALLHDVIIMFALTVICRIQINASFIAAMITIIAYSINDTIIIFDRCRENVKPFKGQKNIDYKSIGDESVRANMTRSVYTTLTTMVTILFLAILGSDSIREFCVPILLGLCAGMFSSVFLASTMWSSMSVRYDLAREKHAVRRGIVYSGKKEEEEVDLTAPKKIKSKDSDGEMFAPTKTKNAGAKQDNDKAKPAPPTHKYSKKNTTFKKK